MAKRQVQQEELNEILTLDNLSLGDLGTYLLFDEIHPESIKEAAEFIIKANYVYKPEQVVTILINSPGGDVYDGFGIIDLIEASKIKVQTTAVGCVASMGALIFTSGTKGHRIMSKNSYLMVHQFSQYMEGKRHEFIAHRKHEDHLNEKFINHFVNRSKLSRKQVIDTLLKPSDTYIEPKDALKFGLCDVIANPWS